MVAAPYTYTGTFATSNVPVTQVETTPGSGTGGAGGTPTPTYVAGKLTFSPATVIDPQRTEGEPLNFLDPKTNDYWESGPFGTTTQNSWIHRSTDNGLEFHVDSPVGLRPDAPPGGGDTDIAVDDQGYHYFVDLEGLVNLGTSVSNDDGNTWRKNPLAVQNVAVDRQWYAIDNGPTTSAADNTIFMGFHETAVGTFIYSSPGTTGPTDPVGGLVWQSASAKAPLPLAADATCGQLRFDPKYRNLYSACNEGDHVRLTIGHVAPGQRTGIQFHNVTLPVSPGGGGPGHLFPALAVDSGGNVYVAWIDINDSGVYYSSSADQGESWTTPVRVSTAPSTTAEFLWAQAGAAGNAGPRVVRDRHRRPAGLVPELGQRPAGRDHGQVVGLRRDDLERGLALADDRAGALHREADALRPDLQPGHRLHGLERRPHDGRLLRAQPRQDRRDPDRLQRHDEPEPRRAPVRGAAARRQDDHRQARQRPRPEEPDEGRHRRRPVAALLAHRRGPEPAAARPDERRVEHGQPEHAAGEDDGRRPGRDAPARRARRTPSG